MEAFASKSTVVVLLGRGPISILLPGYHCVRLKRVESGKRHFVGNPCFYNLIGLNPFDLIGVNEFDVLLHSRFMRHSAQ